MGQWQSQVTQQQNILKIEGLGPPTPPPSPGLFLFPARQPCLEVQDRGSGLGAERLLWTYYTLR